MRSERPVGELRFDDEGELPRRGLPPPFTWVPDRMYFDRGAISWAWWGGQFLDSGTLRLALRPLPEDLIWQFLSLADQPDPRIEGFIRQFGVLGICRHGIPSTHQAACRPRARRLPKVAGPYIGSYDDAAGGTAHSAPPSPTPIPRGEELMEDWRTLAREARAVLRMAAAVRVDESPADEDRELIRAAVYRGDGTLDPGEDALQRYELGLWTRGSSADTALLARFVQQWLSFAGVRPVFSWEGRPRLDLASPNSLKPTMFAALALQLLYEVSRSGKHAVCSSCGIPYRRRRRFPKAGQNNYCEACGKQAANRVAHERHMAKQASADHQ